MTHRPSPSQPGRLSPAVIQEATARAHALRQQAIDDAIGALLGWMRRIVTRRHRLIAREKPCLS